MKYEQLVMEQQNAQDEVLKLKTMLSDMEADWAECARTGKSPCFFCANDDTCTCTNDAGCNFKWKPHN